MCNNASENPDISMLKCIVEKKHSVLIFNVPAMFIVCNQWQSRTQSNTFIHTSPLTPLPSSSKLKAFYFIQISF